MSKEQIHVVGYPRSGNVWMSRLLGDALDSPVKSGGGKVSIADEGLDRTGNYVIRQRHLKRLPSEGKIVFVYRDPRDVAVSFAHYWQTTLQDAIDRIGHGNPKHLKGWSWLRFMQHWYETKYENMTWVSYEQLQKNTVGHLKIIMFILDLKPTKPLQRVVHRQSFAVRKRLISYLGDDCKTYNAGIQNQSMRAGCSGDWREQFTPEQRKQAHDLWWEWLKLLGYESDENWWMDKCLI